MNMAPPANNPFGAPPAQVFSNPFGAPASNQPTSVFGAPAQNPFGAPAVKPNPFGAPTANPFGPPVNNPFSAPISGTRPSSSGSPFGAPSSQASPFGTPASSAAQSPAASRQPSPSGAQNPFGKPPAQARSGGFQALSPFGLQTQPAGASKASPVLGAIDANTMGRQTKFAAAKPSARDSNGFGGRGHNNDSHRPTPFASSKPLAKQTNGRATETNKKSQPGSREKRPGRQEHYQPPPSGNGNGDRKAPTREPTERTKQLSTFAFDYANKLYAHLKRENINPPQWPPEPGNPDKRGDIESLKEAYKKYRARVYASLRKADLIDDPEKRRKLEDALAFKGICEDMCPEFEQVSRIAEYDIKTEEKEIRPDGLTMWPDPPRMVKKFGRSAAGQDAPLPMDVRSVDALRRTTDYLFNDLLQSESNLPSMHNFLWDRTRAVRKDFTFHSQKTAEEMKDMVYCFETLTRFHATALHLLSRKGFANEDFEQKQEIEQLGRTLLSLVEAYDVCRDKRVQCENEAEFRAYYLLLNAQDPSIARRIPTWGKEFWFESEDVQTALSLIHAMDDVREPKGPIKPRRPTTLSDTAFTNYFAIVEDPRVSYTMACIAEIHFTTVRQGILRNLVRGYARHRDAPRTITASDLNAMLRFDTVEEAIEFVELHDFEFSKWVPEGKNPVTEPYLLLNSKKKHVPSPRVRQSFSGKLVERKRTTQSLPYVIYNTIFEEPAEKSPCEEGSPDGLFVSQTVKSVDAVSAASATSTPSVGPFASPAPANTATAPSPFGVTAKDTPLTNGIASSAAAGAPAVTPVPAFSYFQTSKPAGFRPFAVQNHPASEEEKPPFPSLSQPIAPWPTTDSSTLKPTSALDQPAQSKQTTASGLAASQPSEAPSLFSFFNNSGSAQAQTFQPSAPTSSSTLGSAGAPKSSVPFTPPQSATTTSEPKQAKPAPTPSSSPSGPAPLGAALPFSTPASAKPAEQQSAPAAAAVPSISISPPSPAIPFSQTPGQSPVPSDLKTQSSTFSTAGRPTTTPPRPRQPPKRDLMADFTKWFVRGDDGLMEHFIEETLRVMLWDVYKDFQRKEAERKRKEEDEESWRLAREHQSYRLRVKYFYRWRDNARSLATKRILREGKEKMRLYREQQRAIREQQQAEKEKAEREARRAAKRQMMEDSHRFSLLASSARRRLSVAYSADHNAEEQLLASGIFAGLRDDPRAVARRVVREVTAAANGDGWPSAASRSLRYYPESELELEAAPSARESAGSPDSSSVGRREGWKTRSLREKFGIEPRRSLSASGSVIVDGGSVASRFRQSLPAVATNKTTNFSRKRSAEAESDGGEEPDAKRQHYGDSSGGSRANAISSSSSRSRYWDLRARGFVPMPDGNWLPQALARSSLTSSNNAARTAAEQKADEEGVDDGDGDGVDDGMTGLWPPPPEAKKANVVAGGGPAPGREETTAMVENTRRMLRELREYMDRMDRDRAQEGVVLQG